MKLLFYNLTYNKIICQNKHNRIKIKASIMSFYQNIFHKRAHYNSQCNNKNKLKKILNILQWIRNKSINNNTKKSQNKK